MYKVDSALYLLGKGEATTIAERIWTQFYARRLSPKEAAERAEEVVRNIRRTGKQ